MKQTYLFTDEENNIIAYAIKNTFLFDGYEGLIEYNPEDAPAVCRILVELGEGDPSAWAEE